MAKKVSMRNVGRRNDADRVAWVESRLAALPAGGRILDAGAGEQRFRKFCAHLRYVAQDFGQYDGKGDSAGLQMGAWDQTKLDIVSDITAIPEPDGSFDAVLCTEVFEHLPEPVAALREFSRLLAPGGHLVLTAPFCSLTHFSPYHFSTGFNRYFYEKFLPELGFRIQEATPNGNYFEFMAQELRRIPDVATSYARGAGLGLLGWLAQKLLLCRLAAMARRDSGSSELLCYGWHIVAVKE